MNIDDEFYDTDEAAGSAFRMILGDSCEELPKLESDSVDLSVHSPPFDSLYTYSPTIRDMGNSPDRETFHKHYGFVVRELLRLTRPGRMACVHVMDLPTTKATHGVVGLTDFSAEVVRDYQDAGWIFVNRITIRKNPQAAATRTKSHGLAFAQLRRDRSQTRPVYPDYLLLFRKPGQNTVPIISPLSDSGDQRIDNDLWIKWAEAIWDDIRETNTLNVAVARDDADERHLCPLSLDLIERCVRLWSNPGEHVLSPCAGIGSEGHSSLKLGRRFTGVELKRSYWQTAVNNLRQVEAEANALTLFA
jgi:DNA modification methylase